MRLADALEQAFPDFDGGTTLYQGSVINRTGIHPIRVMAQVRTVQVEGLPSFAVIEVLSEDPIEGKFDTAGFFSDVGDVDDFMARQVCKFDPLEWYPD